MQSLADKKAKLDYCLFCYQLTPCLSVVPFRSESHSWLCSNESILNIYESVNRLLLTIIKNCRRRDLFGRCSGLLWVLKPGTGRKPIRENRSGVDFS